jgi:hypothetical protein
VQVGDRTRFYSNRELRASKFGRYGERLEHTSRDDNSENPAPLPILKHDLHRSIPLYVFLTLLFLGLLLFHASCGGSSAR